MSRLWILSRAAAGTGKTVALVRRYLELLRDGVPVEKIAAITFTRKAAAEMTDRIASVLLALLNEPGPRTDEAIRKLDGSLSVYEPFAPAATDRDRIRRALAGLSTAPIALSSCGPVATRVRFEPSRVRMALPSSISDRPMTTECCTPGTLYIVSRSLLYACRNKASNSSQVPG